jgi:hypothetical protein
MEGKAFSRPYDLAPRLPPPPSPISKFDQRRTGRLRKIDYFLTGEGGKGVDQESNHTKEK